MIVLNSNKLKLHQTNENMKTARSFLVQESSVLFVYETIYAAFLPFRTLFLLSKEPLEAFCDTVPGFLPPKFFF